MSKKRKKRSDAISSTPTPIARRQPVGPTFDEVIARIRRDLVTRQLADLRRRAALTAIEDRRTYTPLGRRTSARSFNRAHHVLKVKPEPRQKWRVPTRVMFDAPKKVLVCVRRGRRREVLFAKRKTGAGARRRAPRRNWFSEISC